MWNTGTLPGPPMSLTRQGYECSCLATDHGIFDSVPYPFLAGGMRDRRDPLDDPAPARPRPPARAVPTLGQLLHQPYWLWLHCDACRHRVAVALVPFVIRWGAKASSDMLRTHV